MLVIFSASSYSGLIFWLTVFWTHVQAKHPEGQVFSCEQDAFWATKFSLWFLVFSNKKIYVCSELFDLAYFCHLKFRNCCANNGVVKISELLWTMHGLYSGFNLKAVCACTFTFAFKTICFFYNTYSVTHLKENMLSNGRWAIDDNRDAKATKTTEYEEICMVLWIRQILNTICEQEP